MSEEFPTAERLHSTQSVAALRARRSDARELEPVCPVPQAAIGTTLPNPSDTFADIVRVQLPAEMRQGELCDRTMAQTDSAASLLIYTPISHKNIRLRKHGMTAIRPQAQPPSLCSGHSMPFDGRIHTCERVRR